MGARAPHRRPPLVAWAAFAPFTAVFLYAASGHLVSGRGVVAWVWVALPAVLVSETLWCSHQARRLQAAWEVVEAGRTPRTA